MALNTENVTETIKATGKTLYDEMKRILKAGNIRSIVIKNKNGKTVAQFPLTFGVLGAAILPAVALIALVIGFANDCSIIIEKEPEVKTPTKPVTRAN